jgi:DNA-binding NtrC family response regulator
VNAQASPAPRSAPDTNDTDATSSHWQTVTEVVLSGDTSEEIQTGETGSYAVGNLKDVGVVVFTVDSEFAEASYRALSGDRNTMLATTLTKVAEAIEHDNAGILVTDFTTNSGVLQKIISVLKQHLPELVTIVVSSSRDTTDMIGLINHGQVFRYILKPLDSQSLRNNINAAAVRHVQLRDNPQLNMRHQVVDLDAKPDQSATLNRFVSRIRSVRARSANSSDNTA